MYLTHACGEKLYQHVLLYLHHTLFYHLYTLKKIIIKVVLVIRILIIPVILVILNLFVLVILVLVLLIFLIRIVVVILVILCVHIYLESRPGHSGVPIGFRFCPIGSRFFWFIKISPIRII